MVKGLGCGFGWVVRGCNGGGGAAKSYLFITQSDFREISLSVVALVFCKILFVKINPSLLT